MSHNRTNWYGFIFFLISLFAAAQQEWKAAFYSLGVAFLFVFDAMVEAVGDLKS